jgi:hypothetical protein
MAQITTFDQAIMSTCVRCEKYIRKNHRDTCGVYISQYTGDCFQQGRTSAS